MRFPAGLDSDPVLLEQTPVWSSMSDVVDLTALMSMGFHENFSEVMNGRQTMTNHYEIVDTASNASKVVHFHRKMIDGPEALCFGLVLIIWMGGT
jgi:hypothetical protein